MRAGQPLTRFLAAVHRDVLPLGAGDYLRVERLLRARAAWPAGELRAALCSVIAGDQEQWQSVARLFDLYVAGAQGPSAGSPGPDLGAVLVVSRPPWRLRAFALLRAGAGRALGRLRWLALRTPAWARLAPVVLVLLALCAGVSLEILRLTRPPVERGDQGGRPAPGPVSAPPAPVTDEVTYVLHAPSGQTTPVVVSLPLVHGDEPRALWAALGVVSLLLGALGVRLWLLPARAARARQREVEARAQKALAERGALAEADNRAGRSAGLPYRVPEHLPVPQEAIDDSAGVLGRLFRQDRGVDLDVGATLGETVRAGGRLAPVVESRRVARELLVLVDVEKGDHPYLGGVRRVLAAWHGLGVRLYAYQFAHNLGSLEPLGGGRVCYLAQLARQHEGAALLVCSRRLQARGRDDVAGWVAEVAAWPLRAWLDPDPRPLAERDPSAQAAARRLIEDAKLVRYPLSKAGIIALARYFAEDGIGAPEPPAEGPMSGLDDPGVGQALRFWGAAAEMVPEASWDQLEALRRALPEVHQVLDDGRYVARLIELAGEGEEEPEGDGRRLRVAPAMRREWLREVRAADRRRPFAERLEVRARRVLLEQLGAKAPGEGISGFLWELKVGWHRAFLEPERASELLGRFLGTPVEGELRDWLEQELPAAPGWAPAESEALGQAFAPGGGVLARELVLGHRRLWLGGLAGGVVLALLGLLGAGQLWRLPAGKVAAGVPADGEVVKRHSKKWAVTDFRSAMVSIEAGTFMMGCLKEKDRECSNDEVQHEVRLTRGFAMFETEVTQRQYSTLMGDDPVASRKDWIGNKCAQYGHKPDLPVFCVDFYDAVHYANALSKKEGHPECYKIDKEDVRWSGPGCLGYRLPTEAEWEYAARADQGMIYAGSDQPKDVAVFNHPGGSDVVKGERKANGWGLYDMSGNVWEWVWDWYDKLGDKPATDPVGSMAKAEGRVVRGGSWGNAPRWLRMSSRVRWAPGYRFAGQGFRLSRSLP